jgi:glycosyltransferase involved in cell wall biosynthesis
MTHAPRQPDATGVRAPTRVGMVLTTMGFGGVPEVVFQLMRRLPRDRFATSLCVLKREEDEANVSQDRSDRFSEAGFDVCYAHDSSRKIDTVASVADWIESRGIELLHTHSNRPNVVGRMAATLFHGSGLAVVSHYHNQYDDKWERDPAMLSLERRLASSTHAMIAVSESVRRHVASRIGVAEDLVDVVPNGVDAAAFACADRAAARRALSLDEQRTVVGVVGRITEQKGQEDFVEAALQLAIERPEPLFVMVGFAEDAALQQRLRQRIAVFGLSDRIRFVGNRDDMANVYAAIDVVVAPSRWEGFGMMLVEAMAAGRPIVAARAGAIPEIVRDGISGVLVEPRDPVALGAAIAKLLDDPARRDALAVRGPAESERFGWSRCADLVAEVYERALLRVATGAAVASSR